MTPDENARETKRLDALVVDVEDSTTLLKLYIGRLLKAPGKSNYYASLVEHTREIESDILSLDESTGGRDYLLRLSSVLTRLATSVAESGHATSEQILAMQEAVDALEGQLYHMLRMDSGGSREVLESIDRLEVAANAGDAEPRATHDHDAEHAYPGLSDHFEEDPFDEFALSDDFLEELVSGLDALDGTATGDAASGSGDDHQGPAVSAFRIDTDEVEPGPIQLNASEVAALKELFANIASAYVGPITDFIGRLRVGPVTTGWVDLCVPAVSSMSRASESMGYTDLRHALDVFGALLEKIRAECRVVDGENRVEVLTSYQGLADLLPATFPIVEPDPNAESESIILNSLLKQIKGVGRITIGRLFAAGLVSLESFYVADPSDLAAAAGLRLNLATSICDRFQQYREVSELASDRDLVLRRLESLVDELRTAQFDFKKATLEEWYTHKQSRSKARARRSRQQIMWKINVALAEIGEIALLNDLKDEIYDKRLARLANLVAQG
ncbi:MAG TPA: hypothetical protein PLF26_15110 [Blastocatellia bacterium]|nr:hypothetical protein [Blastocatellia bacterium]